MILVAAFARYAGGGGAPVGDSAHVARVESSEGIPLAHASVHGVALDAATAIGLEEHPRPRCIRAQPGGRLRGAVGERDVQRAVTVLARDGRGQLGWDSGEAGVCAVAPACLTRRGWEPPGSTPLSVSPQARGGTSRGGARMSGWGAWSTHGSRTVSCRGVCWGIRRCRTRLPSRFGRSAGGCILGECAGGSMVETESLAESISVVDDLAAGASSPASVDTAGDTLWPRDTYAVRARCRVPGRGDSLPARGGAALLARGAVGS